MIGTQRTEQTVVKIAIRARAGDTAEGLAKTAAQSRAFVWREEEFLPSLQAKLEASEAEACKIGR
ncbi:MAG: hypothetical protein AB7P69_20400 [Candidatus Binatia bacterium]